MSDLTDASARATRTPATCSPGENVPPAVSTTVMVQSITSFESSPFVEQSVSPKGSSANEGRKNMQITIRYYAVMIKYATASKLI